MLVPDGVCARPPGLVSPCSSESHADGPGKSSCHRPAERGSGCIDFQTTPSTNRSGQGDGCRTGSPQCGTVDLSAFAMALLLATVSVRIRLFPGIDRTAEKGEQSTRIEWAKRLLMA